MNGTLGSGSIGYPLTFPAVVLFCYSIACDLSSTVHLLSYLIDSLAGLSPLLSCIILGVSRIGGGGGGWIVSNHGVITIYNSQIRGDPVRHRNPKPE